VVVVVDSSSSSSGSGSSSSSSSSSSGSFGLFCADTSLYYFCLEYVLNVHVIFS
jgi:hypothetical protein